MLCFRTHINLVQYQSEYPPCLRRGWLTAPRNLHKREGGWDQKSKLRSWKHGISFRLLADYLCFAACSLLLLSHFDECEFIDPLPLSFIYVYFIYRQLRAFFSSLVHSTSPYSADYIRHCSVLLSHHSVTYFITLFFQSRWAFAGKVRMCTLSSIVLRHLNLELNLHSESISNMDWDNHLSSHKIHNHNMSGVGLSRTVVLSQLRSVRGDEKPIPLVMEEQ